MILARSSIRAWCWCVVGAALVWLWAVPALAREVPPLQGRVTDEAGVLSAAQARRIEDRLAAYEQATGRQLAVLTVQSLEGDPLEDFSIRVVEQWQLGRRGQDDGLLLLLAVEERKVRIEVGYGLEGEVTDLVSARIIHDVMRPHLRNGAYGQAIAAGVEALIAVAGPTVAPPEPDAPGPWSRTWLGESALWYALMATALLGVLVVCFWRPLLGVVAVLVMGQIWWPAALMGGLALWLRWQWSRRRRLRDGYGVERPAVAQPGGGGESMGRGLGALGLLAGLGRTMSSRGGRDATSSLARTLASTGARAFLGRGGGFGGGGASGGW